MAIIVIMISVMYVFFICDNSIIDSMNEDTGMGSPMNVFVGPDCCDIIVLYRLSLSIPQDTSSIVGIIIRMLSYSMNIISDGATPNDMASASESIVSPNIGLV